MIRLLMIVLCLAGCLTSVTAQTSRRLVNHFGVAEGLRSPGVNCLAIDSKGFVWIGATSGLTRFDGAHFRTFPMPQGGEGSFVYSPRSMDFDRRDCLWIGTKRGLYQFDAQTETFRRFDREGLGDSTFVQFVGTDGKGRVWAVTEGGHFCIDPDKETCTLVENDTTVSGMSEKMKRENVGLYELIQQAHITNMTARRQDSDGGWWVGTFFEGLFYIHPDVTHFAHITDAGDDGHLLIVRQIIPWNDRVYVGTETGGLQRIVQQPDGTRELRRIPLVWQGQELSGNVQAVAHIGDVLWIGMAWEGIFVFDPATERLTRHYAAGDGVSRLVSDDIVCIYPTSSGDVMVGTRYGLMVMPHGADHFETVRGARQGMVHALAECADRSLYVGYLEEPMQQLRRMDDGVWTASDAGFSHKCVTALQTAPDGSLWIGTDCKGVWQMKQKGTFEPTALSYDVLHSSANTMVFDRDGHLWVSTINGLFAYDTAHDRVRHFTAANDGLPTDLMSFFSAYLTPDGAILMGTYQGLIEFSPASLRQQPVALRPYFTNVRIGQTDTLATPQITLNYDAPSIRIDYSVPGYAHRQRLWYRYRLEGASQDGWTLVEAGEQSIYVSHLAPGRYRLVLQVSLDPNQWDEQMQTELKIRVRPPFWLSIWGFAIYALVAAVIAYLLLRLWRHRIERRNLRQQIASLLRNQELMLSTQATSPYDLIKDIAKNKTDNHLMEQIDELLENNYRNPQLQVEFLAEHLGVSKSTLYRRMREVTSLSPNDYIRLFRLKKAARLLREQGMPIREVSETLCFSSVSYFTNCFSQQFGITPGEYVKQG